MTDSQVRNAQDMNALLFVVGKLLPRVLSEGHVKLPEAEWFEPVLDTYNLKVQKKINAKELRGKIASRIGYIKRRAKQGKEPWYKPYFLHFLGENLEGIMVSKEPADFDELLNEEIPVKQMERSKRYWSSESLDLLASPSPSKRQRKETPFTIED